ncbi:kinase-like protein, partial [Schizopora paradoxa]
SLVSPWMPHGTSKRYLETRSPGEKIRILTNVADGLCYLHRYDVVHGDIKGDNILIDESFEPRLADFGLSKIVSESKAVGDTITHTQGFFGSIRWTAKELFSSPEEFGPPCVTKESDIWAFGMTILELFTSLPPYHKIRSDPQVIIAIHNGRLPEQPDGDCGLDDDMWALCTSCWAENPALRPTTKSLAKRLWELEVK